MKYCSKCGHEMDDSAIVCVACGCTVETAATSATASTMRTDKNGLDLAILIFMILGCISCACAFLIPLCWCIPMTIHVANQRKKGAPIGIGFKICTLLFVNLVAGILLLCREEN